MYIQSSRFKAGHRWISGCMFLWSLWTKVEILKMFYSNTLHWAQTTRLSVTPHTQKLGAASKPEHLHQLSYWFKSWQS